MDDIIIKFKDKSFKDKSSTEKAMTIPANNWCTTCQEAVHDHASICTICGDVLGPPPSDSARPQTTGVRAIPEFVTDDFRQAGREVRDILSNLRVELQDINTIALDAVQGQGAWQDIPAGLLEPQNAPHRGRPTARQTLAKIPRIVLDDTSSLFRQASLEVSSKKCNEKIHFSAIPAEFGPTQAVQLEETTIIVASPRTGKGGLSKETRREIAESSNPLVYMERGDGITFVQKAIQAQNEGAIAAVIGNNMSTPWPYAMKDSKGEAQQLGLRISVVMIKQSDGKALLELWGSNPEPICGTLKMQSLSKDCVVCCETLHNQETVMQLPECGHVFHEKCAMQWLTKHNTCPFCRRELPTDDADYEQERRRTQRTHAGSTAGRSESQWNEYYG